VTIIKGTIRDHEQLTLHFIAKVTWRGECNMATASESCPGGVPLMVEKRGRGLLMTDPTRRG
jgi:hypothetical protein